IVAVASFATETVMGITRGRARGTQAFILRRRWLPLACVALLFLAGCAEVSVEPVVGGGSSSPTAVASVTPEAPPPSVVLILTDDQRWDTLAEMPTVGRELVGHGISFERG